MKLFNYALIAAGLSVLVLTAGCKRSLKQTLQQAESDANAEQQAAEQAERDILWDYPDEWQAFRSGAEAQIAANSKRIDNLQTRAAGDNKLRAEVGVPLEKLTQMNQELKLRLDRYKDDGKLNWDAFKRDFSNDLAALDKDLKNLGAPAQK